MAEPAEPMVRPAPPPCVPGPGAAGAPWSARAGASPRPGEAGAGQSAACGAVRRCVMQDGPHRDGSLRRPEVGLGRPVPSALAGEPAVGDGRPNAGWHRLDPVPHGALVERGGYGVRQSATVPPVRLWKRGRGLSVGKREEERPVVALLLAMTVSSPTIAFPFLSRLCRCRTGIKVAMKNHSGQRR